MKKIFLTYTLLVYLLLYCGICSSQALTPDPQNIQILYNGKEWRNAYTEVKGDQFLFSNIYLPASLTINNMTFDDQVISYDIYNDEIVIPTHRGSVVKLNKEMVDSFAIIFQNKRYRFLNTYDSFPGVKGYVNVLYSGRISLYVKYKKEIESLAVDDKYDLFFQTSKIYVLKDGSVHQISGKNDMLKLLQNYKSQIKDFMKKNRIKISRKIPESFIPVIRYYDSLSN